MAAPTFVSENETDWSTSGTTEVTGSISVNSGDILVALSGSEDWSNSSDNQTITGGSLTWTKQEELATTSNCGAQASTATASSTTSFAVTATKADGGTWAGLNVLVFRDSDGIGAAESTQATGAPSLSITTTQDNSAIVVIVVDWAAVDGASRTWRTVNSITPTSGNGLEKTYFRDGAHYGVYAAYYSDAGAAGAKTVGLSAPGSQTYGIIAIEVKGTASGSSTITPSAGSQTLTGIAPTVTQQFNRTPSVGALALTGIAPLVIVSGVIQPSAGSLSLTGNAPVVTQQLTITPPAGSLTLTGIAPTITASGNVTIAPSTGSLVLTGGTVEQTLTVPPPTAAAMLLTGIAPVVTQGTGRVPSVGSLALTGIAPVVTQQIYRTPTTGSLALTGVAPSVNGAVVIDPATGSLSLSGSAPIVTQQITIRPGTGSLTLTGYDAAGAAGSGNIYRPFSFNWWSH